MSNGKRSEGARVTGGSGTARTRAGFAAPQVQPQLSAANDPANRLHPSNQGGAQIGPTFQPASISPVKPGATSVRDNGRRSR